jgi:ribosome recycling factor
VNKLKDTIAEIKLSRSNPKILDNTIVNVKGKKYKLNELGTIMVRGANVFVINPYESDHKEPIIKSIESSKLDVQITSEENNVVITLGAIPNDIKLENLQLLKKQVDQTKESIKSIRQSCNNEMKKLEKILGKDEGKRLETAIFDHIDKYISF